MDEYDNMTTVDDDDDVTVRECKKPTCNNLIGTMFIDYCKEHLVEAAHDE